MRRSITPIKERKFVDVDGVNTSYYESGEGPTVVLFSGGGFSSLPRAAHSGQDWDLNFYGLAKWFRVIAVDKLGHGYTDSPREISQYNREAQIRHAQRFIEILDLDQATIVGHSQGGALVTRTAIQMPHRISNCVIVDSGSLAPGVTRALGGNPPEPNLSKESQRWVLQKYSFGWDHITDGLLDEMVTIANQPRYQEMIKIVNQEGVRQVIQAEILSHQEETLQWIREGRLKKPTLIVWGYNDPTAPLHRGHALMDLVVGSAPRTEMHILDKAGHFSFREHPQAFNQVLRSFVQ